ncbi:MAG: hypothetical protein AAFQ94_11755 [Bacteroidota bacterium]
MSTQTLNGIAINNYPVFEGSQVLTSEQLNDLFSYLDQQNRFTRSKLIGIGIVCGLQITTTSNSVVLSKGLGITSDGFLIKMPDCTMKYRRPYELPAGVYYESFGNFDKNGVYSQDKDIVLHELLAKEPADDTFYEIDKDFFDDMYMLIYLECFDRDPRSCLGKNCEDLGKERIFTIRKLAVKKGGLAKILDKSNGSILNPYAVSSGLEHIDLPKPLFANGEEGCKNYEAFVNLYVSAIKGGEDTKNVFDLLFGAGSGQGLLAQTYSKFQPLLAPVYNYKNPLSGNSRFSKVKSEIRKILEGSSEPTKYNIQSLYEYLTILVKAYHEFVSAAELLVSDCGPENEFSLHLALGKIYFDVDKELDEIDILGESKFRHQFLQPRIFNEQADQERKVISFHKRLVLLLESFELDRLNDRELPLKITPTNTSQILGDKSIPYFLQPAQTGNTDGIRKTQLDREWNFGLTVSSRLENRVISYDNNKLIAGEPLSSPAGLVQTPLFFPAADQAFRIAGGYRKEIELVKKLVSDQRTKFNLPFEILPVRFGGDISNIVVDNHYWLDLQSDYKLVKSGIITAIRNVLGALKAFERTAREWTYNFPYANVENFKAEIDLIFEEIEKSLGLYEEGERLMGILPDTIDELYNNGAPVVSIPDYNKMYRRNLSKAYLRLEYATEILNWEKIDVLPHKTFLNWTKEINLLKEAITDFLGNSEFFRLFNLYHRFVNRYQFLQENHFSVFCNFLKQHPGIETKPVDRGGTHIIVYDDSKGEKEEKVVLADFNLPYRLREDEMHIPLDPALDKIKLPPVARGEAVLIRQGDSKLIDVKANDLDPNGDLLNIVRKGYTDLEGKFKSGKSFKGADLISNDGDNDAVKYQTNEETIGNDYFEYTIENTTDATLTDEVIVEILVTSPYQKHVNAIDDLAATDNHHSVVIDLLLNDVSYGNTQVVIPELSEFGAGLTLLPDRKVRYNPVYGREGKDSFTYELEQVRSINGAEVIEKSKATVNVIVYCCDTVEFELICEGNTGEFDVLTAREKEEGAELVLMDEKGEPTDEIKTNSGSVKVVKEIEEPDEEKPVEGSPYLLYTPKIDYTGLEEFTYEVIDKEGFIRRVRMHVMVVKCSETKLIRTLKETAAYFTDIDADAKSVKLFSDRSELQDDIETQNGAAKVQNTDGGFRIVYEPNESYYGLDMLQYAFQDQDGFWHYNHLNIIIDGYEKVRVESTFQDNPAVFRVLSERMLEEGFTLNVFKEKSDFKDKINTDEGGAASVTDGDIRYEPKTSFLGDDSFNYAILKDGLPFEYGRFYVILDTNRKVSVEYTRRGDSKEVYLLTAEQVEKEATLEIVSGPVVSGAKATVEKNDGVSFIKYVPADGYVGQDNFDYIIELDDVKLFGTVYMVVDSNIRIEVTSVFKDDQTSLVLFDKELKVDEFEILTDTVNGTSAWSAGRNAVSYKPNPDFTGHDKLHYKATFGDSTQYGTIFFLVICECKDIQVIGTVTDETETGLQDVRVQEVGTESFVLTGRTGIYNINASPSATLRFTKITHETEEIDVAYRTTVNAQLRRKRVIISGRVTSEEGEALSNVVVASELGSKTTDTDGRYEIETYVNAAINYTLLGYLPQTRTAASVDSEINVQLVEGKVTLFITARDKEFGQILDGNVVEEVETGQRVVTNNSTKMVVGLSSKLIFAAAGFQNKEVNVGEITFDATLEAELDVLLDPAIIEVTGTVRNEAGQPIESANILIASEFATATDAEGKYKINLPLWSPFAVISEAYQPSEQTLLIPRTSDPSIVISDTIITDANKAEVDFILKNAESVVAGVIYRENSSAFLNGATLSSGDVSLKTEIRGEFNMRVPIGEELTVSASGYVSQKIPITKPNEWLEIRMKDDIGKTVNWEEQLPLNELNNQHISTSFSIGDKIYLIIGNSFDPNRPTSSIARLFEFDVQRNKWTRKQNFPGTPRSFPVSFVVENKAYVGLGRNSIEDLNDFWCFDPETEGWTQVDDYPGEARVAARGFTIGNLGFVGTGLSKDGTHLKEFWAFDPNSRGKDKWTRQPDLPGEVRQNASGFSIDGVGYLGAGRNQSGLLTDLWSFTPEEGWSRIADMANGVLPMGGDGNLGFAVDGEGFIAGAGYRNRGIIAYSPKETSWVRVSDMPTLPEEQFAVVCNGTAYVGAIVSETKLLILFKMS